MRPRSLDTQRLERCMPPRRERSEAVAGTPLHSSVVALVGEPVRLARSAATSTRSTRCGRRERRGRGAALLRAGGRVFSLAAVTASTACHGGELGSDENQIYELAEVLREVSARAYECPEQVAVEPRVVEATAIARLTRASWWECIEPVRRYYECVLDVPCDLWNTTSASDACAGVEQEAYDLCPKLPHLPL